MKLKTYLENYRYYILGVVLLLFLIARALFVPPLHDEIATLFYFVETGDILNELTNLDANNHLLNSYFGRILYLLFDPSLFVFRLPNILAFLLFFIVSIQIFKEITDKKIQFFAVLALNTTPFIIEYFALTRGYGLGMGFMLLMLLKLSHWLKKQSFYALLICVLAGVLSVFSNLVFLNSFLIALTIILFITAYHFKKTAIKKTLIRLLVIVTGFALILPLINFGLRLRANEALYYGDSTSFWEVTGRSLSKMLFYTDHFLIKYTLLLFIIGVVGHTVLKTKNLISNLLHDTGFLLSIFFVGNLIGIFMLALFFNINYPEDRAAIYLVVLGLLLFAILIPTYKIKYGSYLLLLFPVLFLVNLNFSHALVTPDQHLQKEFYHKFRATIKNQPTAIYPTQHLTWAYYERDQPKKKLVSSSKEVNELTDYIITRPPYSDSVPLFTEIITDEISNAVGLARKSQFGTALIYTKAFSAKERKDEFATIDKIVLPEALKNSFLEIWLAGSIRLAKNYKHCSLVIDATYADDSHFYNAYPFHWFYSPKNCNFEFELTQRLPKKRGLENIKVYLWNKYNRNIKFIKGKYELRRILIDGTR